jgi:hypothetical protein
MSGMASARQFFDIFTTAFPDAKCSSDALFGVDDVVVSELAMTATHAGPLGPLKPTKKPVTMHGLDIIVVKDGKAASGSSYSSSFELLGQEGLLPKHKSGTPALHPQQRIACTAKLLIPLCLRFAPLWHRSHGAYGSCRP